MAYVLTGGAKKGIKFALTLPNEETTTRSYSGLNMSQAGGSSAQTGPTYSNATRFFNLLIYNLTTATVSRSYITTEQEIAWED